MLIMQRDMRTRALRMSVSELLARASSRAAGGGGGGRFSKEIDEVVMRIACEA